MFGVTTQVPGSASRFGDKVTVAATVWLTPPLLLAENEPLMTFPGPVQASGSLKPGTTTLLTVTAKLQVEVLLTASLTEQLTVVTPSGNAKPEAGVQTGV